MSFLRPTPASPARWPRSSRPWLALALLVLAACGSTPDDNQPPTPGVLRVDRRVLMAGSAVRFQCIAREPEKSRLTFEFDWGDGSAGPTTSESVEGDTVFLTRVFDKAGRPAVRCRGVDAKGKAGDWSSPTELVVYSRAEGATLTVARDGEGTVSSTPEGIACGEKCDAVFATETPVDLIATPGKDERFIGWSGDCSGESAKTQVVARGDLHCVARFAPKKTRFLTAEVAGEGRVTSAKEGIDCPGTCAVELPQDTPVTLTATPREGWRFLGWWGCGSNLGPAEVMLDLDRRCLARFAPEPESAAEWRHAGARLPSALAWSPDGARIAAIDGSLADEGMLRVWDADTGKVQRLIPSGARHFGALAWSPKDGLLAAGRGDGMILLLDPTTGRAVREWKAHEGNVQALAWSPDGARLASADGTAKEVRLWNAATGAREEALVTVDRIRRLTWSPDGNRLAMAAGLGVSPYQFIIVHKPGEVDPEYLLENVNSFAWSPDGKRFAVDGHEELRLYDSATGTLAAKWSGPWPGLWSIDWSPDGRWIVGANGRFLRVMEAETGALVADLADMLPTNIAWRGYEAVRFHPSRPEFAVLGLLNPTEISVFTVDAEAHTARKRELLPHYLSVSAVAWSPTGDRLASGGFEGTLRLWSAQGLQERTLPGHDGKEVRALSWNATGSLLASGGDDGKVRLWRVADGAPARTPFALPEGHQVFHVALSPDGTRLAAEGFTFRVSPYRSEVRVWDVTSGQELAHFSDSPTRATHLTWTPDGQRLVTVWSEAAWTLWDASTGERRFLNPGAGTVISGAALSPEGTRLVTGGKTGLTVWNPETGAALASWSTSGQEPSLLAWHPEGHQLAGNMLAGLVHVWDVRAPTTAPRIVGGHDGATRGVSWRPDGRALTTGGSDSALVTWRFTP